MIQKKIIGYSVEQRPIECLQLTQGTTPLLILGGVHGDEPEGIDIVTHFLSRAPYQKLEGLSSLYVVPQVNPDGCAKNQRTNANGVDLNRNMQTKDWSPVAAKERYNPGPAANSEPETRILENLILELKPKLIITMHSWEPMINYNGPCKALALHMAKFSQYKIADYIGYPTPGSLGTWAGFERNISTITLEIERDLDKEIAWNTHGESILEGLIYACQHSTLD